MTTAAAAIAGAYTASRNIGFEIPSSPKIAVSCVGIDIQSPTTPHVRPKVMAKNGRSALVGTSWYSSGTIF